MAIYGTELDDLEAIERAAWARGDNLQQSLASELADARQALDNVHLELTHLLDMRLSAKARGTAQAVLDALPYP